MKFRFPLEKVMQHKRSLENVAHKEWAEAQALVDESLKELDSMYGLIEETRKRAADREGAGDARGFEIAQLDEFVNGQKIRIERHRQKVRELMGEAERRHEILVQAARERKTFEKLRERQYEDFKLLKKKIELKEMDELVVTRHKRTGPEE